VKRWMLLAPLLVLMGCADPVARQVLRTRDAGVVAIPDNTDRYPNYNRSQALDIINDHVGRRYEIEKEEEFVLGATTTNESAVRKRNGWNWIVPWRLSEEAATTNTSNTRNQTEYRIHYRRGD
jgi:hypothetical protein